MGALSIAVRSLRRDLGHSVAMVVTLALGLTAWASAGAAVDAYAVPPRGGMENVFRVEIERDQGDPPAPRGPVAEPLAFRDRALLASEVPSASSDFFIVPGTTRVPGAPLVSTLVAFSTRDAASLFGMDIETGEPWGAAADRGEERAAVIDPLARDELFGARAAVGESIEVFGERFRVVGVLAPPPGPPLKAPAPYVVLPSSYARGLAVRPPSFRLHDDGARDTDAFFASENTWIEIWVRLDDDTARSRYEAELAAYVAAQRAQGRPLLRAHLTSRAEIHRIFTRDPGSDLFLLFGSLLVGAIGLHLARFFDVKFRAGRAELAARRAFGASRGDALAVHVVEAGLVSLLGVLLAAPGTAATLAVLNRVIAARPTDYAIGPVRAIETVALALVVGLAGSIYPALRQAWQPPARGLRRC